MIPLRDVIPSRTTPFVTVTIIVLNAVAWLYELRLPREELPYFLQQFGVVPAYFSTPTLISSMFLHGSWSHVLGNMWYLWIFGDNVEDRLGHGRFLNTKTPTIPTRNPATCAMNATPPPPPPAPAVVATAPALNSCMTNQMPRSRMAGSSMISM